MRFYAIDSTLTCATAADRDALAAVVRLLDDDDSGVRWNAIQFFARAAPDQISATIRAVDRQSASHDGLMALIDDADTGERIVALLNHESPIVRRLALAAAMRIRTPNDRALRAAAESVDPEIRAIASEELQSRMS